MEYNIVKILYGLVFFVSVRIDRIGEVSVANSTKMSMKIIAYRNAHDIDVEFADGAKAYRLSYDAFKKGKVKYPSSELVGQSRVMRNGHLCTIIAARGYEDIDVIFDNNVVNNNQTMSNYRAGVIGFPRSYLDGVSRDLQKSRVGMYRQMNNGLGATIVAYRDADDIDIAFDTGEIKYHVRYSNFVRGNVSTRIRFDKTGQSNVMANGMVATVIAYRAYSDIDVEFEDGKIREHVGYKEFRNGHVGHDAYDELVMSRVGECILHKKSGMMMTLIKYRSAFDVDIQFEDGVIVTHKSYRSFRDGMIQYPISNYVSVPDRVGTRFIMNNGLLAECIAYRSCHDIDVRFVVDDSIVREKSWHDFVMCQIAHPYIKSFSSMLERNARLYLDNNGVLYNAQVIFKNDNLVGVGGRYLSYDFAICDDVGNMKLFIECQGQQHYHPVDLFGGEIQFEIQQEHDRRKREYAESIGVPLLEIPYTADTYEKVAEILHQAGI